MHFQGNNITEHAFKKYKSIRCLIYFEKNQNRLPNEKKNERSESKRT